MPADVIAEPAVVMFARNAAAKMAGPAARPRSRNAAMAMPVGGQMAVALGWIDANESPIFAAAK